MNYFLKGFRHGQKTFWLLIGYVAMMIIAFFDIFLGPRLFYGYFFLFTVAFNVLGLIGLASYWFYRSHSSAKEAKAAEITAAVFEAQREKDIRRILEHKPDFNTHCFECIRFDPDLKHCSRDLEHKRVMEVLIEKKKYCLYWEGE